MHACIRNASGRTDPLPACGRWALIGHILKAARSGIGRCPSVSQRVMWHLESPQGDQSSRFAQDEELDFPCCDWRLPGHTGTGRSPCTGILVFPSFPELCDFASVIQPLDLFPQL